jgi:hypothetical protein
MRISILGLGILLLWTAGIAAAGGPYYVDPVNGNDANDGLSEEEAWLTVPYADLYADNGSTVYLTNGTYPATISIDRNTSARNGSTPSSWAHAVTFTNAPGHTPTLPPFYFFRNQNRYIIFDSLDFLCTVRTSGSYVVQVDEGAFLKWHDCHLKGTITIDPNDGESRWGEYTNYVVKCGDSVLIRPYHDLIFDGCEIEGGGLYAVLFGNYSAGNNQIVDCNIHDCGNGPSLQPPLDGTGAGDLVHGCVIHNQSMCWLQDNSNYVHGSGISAAPHCTLDGNRIFAWGTTSGITCYLLAASGINGNTLFIGTWEDSAKKFAAGEIVTQDVTGAKGRTNVENYPAAPTNTQVWLERATSVLAFDSSHDIVSDTNADRIFHVSSISTTQGWGGFHGMTITNNRLSNVKHAQTMLWYYLGKDNSIVNNTFMGCADVATGDGYLHLGPWYIMERQYGEDTSSNVICSNILGLNVPQIPLNETFTGNVCFSYRDHESQAELDANHPGNLVLCDSEVANEDGTKLWTGGAGNLFVGGTGFDAHAHEAPIRNPVTQRIEVSGWVIDDIAHTFDLVAASSAIGFGDPANYVGVDFWNDPRNDGYPDSGCDELAGSPPPPLSSSTAHWLFVK